MVELVRQIPVCTLCGRLADIYGVYLPKDQQAHKALPGKLRSFGYALCWLCRNDPNHQAKIEEAVIGYVRMTPAIFSHRVTVNGGVAPLVSSGTPLN